MTIPSLLKKVAFGLAIGLLLALLGTLAFAYRNVRLERGTSAIKSQNYVEAMKAFKPLALVGDSIAQFLVGNMYAFGMGVPKSESEALYWFRRAGMWYSGSGDRGAEAGYYVAKEYAERGKLGEAEKWYRLAAEGGSRQGAEYLSRAYEQGLLGLAPDSEKAQAWREKAKQLLPPKLPR